MVIVVWSYDPVKSVEHVSVLLAFELMSISFHFIELAKMYQRHVKFWRSSDSHIPTHGPTCGTTKPRKICGDPELHQNPVPADRFFLIRQVDLRHLFVGGALQCVDRILAFWPWMSCWTCWMFEAGLQAMILSLVQICRMALLSCDSFRFHAAANCDSEVWIEGAPAERVCWLCPARPCPNICGSLGEPWQFGGPRIYGTSGAKITAR